MIARRGFWVALSCALALHVAGFWLSAASGGASGGGGGDGDGAGSVALEAADAEARALIAAWTSTPETRAAPNAQSAPVQPDASSARDTPDTPPTRADRAPSAPKIDAPQMRLDAAFTPPKAPPRPTPEPKPKSDAKVAKPKPKPKPKQRPKPEPKQAAAPRPEPEAQASRAKTGATSRPASAAGPSAEAIGARGAARGAGSSAGRGSDAAAGDGAARATALQRWGAQIRLAVERRKRRLERRAGRDQGVVKVRVVAAPDGGLVSAALSASSGSGRLDDMALAAVRAAAPFPRAPAEVTRPATFVLPIRFKGR